MSKRKFVYENDLDNSKYIEEVEEIDNENN